MTHKRGGTVLRSELSNIRMTTGNEKKYDVVIDGRDLKEWVGMGWVKLGTALNSDHRRFPTVVEREPCFKCPKCGKVSYNANDRKHAYCGACKEFVSQ
jgi:ribosomal protein S27AE